LAGLAAGPSASLASSLFAGAATSRCPGLAGRSLDGGLDLLCMVLVVAAGQVLE
jgi:hypothetical protein